MANLISSAAHSAASWAAKQHTGNMVHAYKKLNGKDKKVLSPDRLIEGCYEASYAGLLIEICRNGYIDEQAMFVTAVNWLEGSIGGMDNTLGFDVQWTRDIQPPSFSGANSLVRWIFENFIQRGSKGWVNIDHNLRRNVERATGFKSQVRALQKAKKFVAYSLASNMATYNFDKEALYLKNIWNFNRKFGATAHHSDKGAKVQKFCDDFIADGRTYADIAG